MSGWVDISQSTASYVISHTRECGIIKLNIIQINLNTIINNIVNQKLNNYEDIVNVLLATGTDRYESKLIMKFAGYTTELPPELLNKNRNENNNEDNNK